MDTLEGHASQTAAAATAAVELSPTWGTVVFCGSDGSKGPNNNNAQDTLFDEWFWQYHQNLVQFHTQRIGLPQSREALELYHLLDLMECSSAPQTIQSQIQRLVEYQWCQQAKNSTGARQDKAKHADCALHTSNSALLLPEARTCEPPHHHKVS